MLRSRHRRGWSVARLGKAVVVLDLVIVGALAIHLAGGAAVAGRDEALVRETVNPIEFLGLTLDDSRCAKVPLEIGKGFVVTCRNYTAITSPGGKALVVSLYGPSQGQADRYLGLMPQKLAWGMTIQDVWDLLGKPNRITNVYGTPTLVYRYNGMPYGSLELRFNGADRLASINACLTH